jgi:uncharacterized membrane protein
MGLVLAIIVLISRRTRFRDMENGPYRRQERSQTTQRNEKAALDVLNSRYAAGEITKEEYDRVKKEILS